MRRLPLLFALVVSIASTAHADGSLRHTGFLLNALDQPVTATRAMTFRLRTQATAAQGEPPAVWEGSCSVEVKAGYYAVDLGDTCGSAIPEAALPVDQNRWLEVVVEGIALSPRQHVAPVPAAARAIIAQRAAGLASAPTCVNGAIYYDTTQNAFRGCAQGSWVLLGGNACVATPTDVTLTTLSHYSNANCTPYYSDISSMSAKTTPAGSQFGMHNSCSAVQLPAYGAIDFGSQKAISRLRVLLHGNPMKGAIFQGSNDSTNGVNGTWTSLTGPVDMPSGMELQWWEWPTFTNRTPYRMYRLYSQATPAFALYRWQMFECQL